MTLDKGGGVFGRRRLGAAVWALPFGRRRLGDAPFGRGRLGAEPGHRTLGRRAWAPDTWAPYLGAGHLGAIAIACQMPTAH